MLEKIPFLDALDIPDELHDACLEIDDEFPHHYGSGIVRINIDQSGNPFVQWLIEKHDFKFVYGEPEWKYGLLAVMGT